MKKLERSLGLGPVLVVGFSAMLGTGIFVAPGIIYNATGPSFILAFIVAGLLILPAAMSMSELATSMPTSGGIYVYTDRTFGPLLGTIVGFGLWLSLLFKSAFALKGFGEYLSIFYQFPAELTALLMLILVVVLNIGGVSKVASSLAFIIAGCLLTVGITSVLSISSMDPKHLDTLFIGGPEGFMVALSLGIGAYAGLTKLTAIAEEVQEPEKNLPKGILYSLLGVGFVYGAISLTLALALSPYELKGNITPLYTLAGQVLGPWGGKFLAIMAILTLVSMANAGVLAASRFPFAMSRDHLLPKIFGGIHPRFLTPLWSIILSGLIIGIIILTLDVEKVAKLASVFIIQMFILVNFTVITLRESGVQWYKPKYRSPMYPFFHIFGISSGLVLLFYMGELTLMSLVMVGIPSFVIYFFFGNKTNRMGVIGIKGKRTDLVAENETKPIIRCLETLDVLNEAKVVVPLFGHESSPEVLTEMAHALSEGNGVEVVHITEVPEQTELNDIDDPPGLKALRRRIMVMAEDRGGITFDSVATHDLTKTLYDIGQRVHCDWLLVEWSGRRSGRMTFYNPIGWIKDHLHCHVAFFSDKGVRNIRKILVLLKGNECDELVIHTARVYANANSAAITIVKEKKPGAQVENKRERELVQELLVSNNQSGLRVSQTEVNYDDKAESIVNLSIDYDLLIFSKDESTSIQRFLGTRDDIIISKAACSVLRVNLGK